MLSESTIEKEYINAMKNRDMGRVGTLRLLKAAISNAKIQKAKEILEEAELIDILQKQAKQRKESIESYEKAARKDLADKEKTELEIINSYLPKQLSPEEIKAFAQKAIAQTGAKTKADIGKVMKVLMPEVKGKADGSLTNRILSELLP